jgi:hypothetical protein
MEKVIYNNKGGMGVILEGKELEADIFNPLQYKVGNEILQPQVFTTLGGLFIQPVRYVGALIGDCDYLCFHLGDETDLFTIKSYYSCFKWLTETRLVNKYAEKTARDLNWVNGVWK